MTSNKNYEINFGNISSFLTAIYLTNCDSKSCIPNDFVCYYLMTGKTNCFSKRARKIMNNINHDELIIDIQAALLLHDGISELLKKDQSIIDIHSSNYREYLYKGINTSLDANFHEFVPKFKENFNVVVCSNRFSINIIIDEFLTSTLNYVNKLFTLYLDDKKKHDEYNSVMAFVIPVLESKEEIFYDVSFIGKVKKLIKK